MSSIPTANIPSRRRPAGTATRTTTIARYSTPTAIAAPSATPDGGSDVIGTSTPSATATNRPPTTIQMVPDAVVRLACDRTRVGSSSDVVILPVYAGAGDPAMG